MKYFVTGTDTGVGKTYVTVAMTAGLRRAGRPARAVKPIETGWSPGNTDAEQLAAVSGMSLQESLWQSFKAPRSPKAAAALEGKSIDHKAMTTWCARQSGDPLFIEGAGGWAVPICKDVRMSDLAVRIADAVIIVARAGLGTVNHSILTIEAVAQRAPLTGVVLSRRPEDAVDFTRENADEIAAQTGARVAVFPDDESEILAWFHGGFDEQPTHPMG
ncbi:MAG: dethiobiotin synthase [Myxococcales bacterium]|nr:dethiobiotin synthase [Myxococcales bacterium]MBK7191844.1 dethiobiotin synthase [Myxococcales bacterium]MBP6842509.1 dethiobiotin synthase [Kofleriaceae bacterium]